MMARITILLAIIAALVLSPIALLAENSSNSDEPRGFMGFLFAAQPNLRQLEVLDLYPGGPAEKAGIEKGDVLFAFNGVRFLFKGLEDAARAFDWVKPGDRVRISLRRQGEVFDIDVVATQMPSGLTSARATNSPESKKLMELLEGGVPLVIELLPNGGARATLGGAETLPEDLFEQLRAEDPTIGDFVDSPRSRSRIYRLRVTGNGAKGSVRYQLESRPVH